MTTFRATVELGRKTATGIVVPEKVVTELGSSRRPAVVPETRARRIAKAVDAMRDE